MTPETFSALSASHLVPANYASQARDARRGREEQVRHLITQRKLPQDGWSDRQISLLLDDFSQMDSNNFSANCGVGEREARIYSDLVSRRHFDLGHGVGRSGDLCEVQPKAAGSSALNKLTGQLVLDLLRQLGVRSCKEAAIFPVATGMTLSLCLLALRKLRPKEARYVVWSRIDQKSCFKSIICAGFEPAILELVSEGDELRTDVEGLEKMIIQLGGPDKVVAVMSTTSCFAPRAADDLPKIGKICTSLGIPHVINNAYGIQSSKCLHLIEQCGKECGDNFTVFVQSADKNFLVPVGGAVVAGFKKEWVQTVSQVYPGRASSSPMLDLFITLMSMGVNGYNKLLKERKENYVILKEEMKKIAEKYGEKVLETKNNPISIAMTLENVSDETGDGKSISEVGSMLFTRGVSGTRVLTGKEVKVVEGFKFTCWGSHSAQMSTPYLTAAASIGMTRKDIDLFIKRLDKVLATKSTFGGKKQRDEKSDSGHNTDSQSNISS